MGWKAGHNKNLGILEVTFTGSPEIEELKAAVMSSLKLCYEKQVTRVLADCSKMVSSVNDSIMSTYELGSFYESLKIEILMKEAIILPENEKAAAMMYFFETTARNRGFNVRVFAERDDALSWLLKV
ncbi:MAG: hypothetical protein IPN08_11175 [Bacteroidales bacterium]|nr:hypothetical protein [Bacteroidales bacterium]MBK9357935.1 hypothetical protein [Bacteroidales bacterium]